MAADGWIKVYASRVVTRSGCQEGGSRYRTIEQPVQTPKTTGFQESCDLQPKKNYRVLPVSSPLPVAAATVLEPGDRSSFRGCLSVISTYPVLGLASKPFAIAAHTAESSHPQHRDTPLRVFLHASANRSFRSLHQFIEVLGRIPGHLDLFMNDHFGPTGPEVDGMGWQKRSGINEGDWQQG